MKNNILKLIWILPFILVLISSCKKENLDDLSTTLYVRHKGADMPAYIYGNASEKVFLIILHGGPGDGGRGYRVGAIKSEIEKNCAVVYFDQRGSGMSAGHYSEDDVSVDIMAEDVMALVAVIRHKYGNDSKFFLLGHSWGGTLGTATLLANDNQNAFKGWIEVDGGHDLKKLYFDNITYFKQVATEQIALGNNVDYWNGILHKMDNIASQYNEDDASYLNSEANKAIGKLQEDGIIKKERKGLIKDAINSSLLTNGLTTSWNALNIKLILGDNQKIFETLSYTDRLGEITIPSLVLWGRYDLVIPPKQGQEAFDNLGAQQKEIIFFEKSGHTPFATEGDKFAQEVIEFINKFK